MFPVLCPYSILSSPLYVTSPSPLDEALFYAEAYRLLEAGVLAALPGTNGLAPPTSFRPACSIIPSKVVRLLWRAEAAGGRPRAHRVRVGKHVDHLGAGLALGQRRHGRQHVADGRDLGQVPGPVWGRANGVGLLRRRRRQRRGPRRGGSGEDSGDLRMKSVR